MGDDGMTEEARPMDGQFAEVDRILGRIERLAEALRADPDGYVRRAATALREAFGDRRAVEPAVERMRRAVRTLRQDNRDGSRREYQRRSKGIDDLDRIIADDLVPQLRRLGFDV